jgi:lipoprotein-anchoring transpeptidase ErfK/SrfK
MRPVFVSACVASCVAGSFVLTASAAWAQNQPLLDPGWQVGYPVSQANGGGAVIDGGFLQYMFGNGGAQPVIQRTYQPAPVYYHTVPMQPRSYRTTPVYYQMVGAPQARAYQSAPVYYQMVSAPQARTYQRTPVYYYQVVSAPQTRAYQPGPVYYQLATSQQQRPYQVAPAYYQAAPAPQPSPSQVAASSYQAAPPQQFASQLPPVSIHQLLAPQKSAEGSSPATRQMAQVTAPAAAPISDQPPPPQPAAVLNLASIDPVPGYAPSSEYGDMVHAPVDPKYDRQIVDYKTDQPPGTIVIDTPHYFLYLVLEGGKAIRYGIGVGRPGFTWAGMKEISAMREWPDWYPPDDMLKRRPDLPRYMAGGINNPLGARALYLGSTLYRIHGSNEPWTIGTQVSSGCIRLRNEDVVDLYGRVKVGTKVLVI